MQSHCWAAATTIHLQDVSIFPKSKLYTRNILCSWLQSLKTKQQHLAVPRGPAEPGSHRLAPATQAAGSPVDLALLSDTETAARHDNYTHFRACGDLITLKINLACLPLIMPNKHRLFRTKMVLTRVYEHDLIFSIYFLNEKS